MVILSLLKKFQKNYFLADENVFTASNGFKQQSYSWAVGTNKKTSGQLTLFYKSKKLSPISYC